MKSKFKLAVLVSGRGSNLGVLIRNIHRGILKAEITVVISDNFMANAMNIALENGIPAVAVERSGFTKKREFEGKILNILKGYSPDLIVLAGFMQILSSDFIREYKQKIINIHPSLLPSFRGLDAQGQALDYGVKVTGATVHFVDDGVDSGPIILQGSVPVKQEDTRESLAERILKKEHEILTKAIDLIRRNKVQIEGRKIFIKK
ncbi:MAG TPA: phosphoribosylglycinamide formyltransferase [Firmicutes bacterium]|nr:phosphoribosylglycinamide formyltransferase [Bacillota bacterium]